MNDYLSKTILQVSNEQSLRATHLINEIIAQNQEFSIFIKNKLKNRWNMILDLFSKQQRLN
jgi:hypothetical protein